MPPTLSSVVAVPDGAEFGLALRGNGAGVIPEVQAVDIAVVKPDAHMMRVVIRFVGHGGVITRDRGATGRAYGVQHGLKDGWVPPVGREFTPVDNNLDAVFAGNAVQFHL